MCIPHLTKVVCINNTDGQLVRHFFYQKTKTKQYEGSQFGARFRHLRVRSPIAFMKDTHAKQKNTKIMAHDKRHGQNE